MGLLTHRLLILLAVLSSGCSTIVEKDESATFEPERWTRVHDTIGADMPRAVALTTEGAAVVVGFVRPAYDAEGDDAWVAAYGPDGGLQWSKTLRAGPGQSEDGLDVTASPDGGVVVLASVTRDETPSAWLLRLGPQGALRWERTFEGVSPKSVSMDGLGMVTVVGWRGYGASSRAWRARLSADGDPLWEARPAGDASSMYWSVASTAEGRVFAIRSEGEDDERDFQLEEIGRDGDVVASVTGCGPRLAVGPGGVLAVAGDTRGTDVVTVCRYEQSLERSWRVEQPRPSSDWVGVSGASVGADGQILVSGSAYGGMTGEPTVMFVQSYGADSTLRWDDVYAGIGGGFIMGVDVAADAAGNVVTAAIVSNEDYAIATRKVR